MFTSFADLASAATAAASQLSLDNLSLDKMQEQSSPSSTTNESTHPTNHTDASYSSSFTNMFGSSSLPIASPSKPAPTIDIQSFKDEINSLQDELIKSKQSADDQSEASLKIQKAQQETIEKLKQKLRDYSAQLITLRQGTEELKKTHKEQIDSIISSRHITTPTPAPTTTDTEQTASIQASISSQDTDHLQEISKLNAELTLITDRNRQLESMLEIIKHNYEQEKHEYINKLNIKSNEYDEINLKHESSLVTIQTLTNALDQLSHSNTTTNNTLQQELNNNNIVLQEKDNTINDTSNKLKNVTEKLREMMKKYTDLKSTYQSHIQSESELKELLQQKEGEYDEALKAKVFMLFILCTIPNRIH